MTKSGKSKCPAASRVEITPTPTEAKCCNHFDNSLIAKLLHASAVGTGFIPVLPTTDKIQSKCPAAARVGINPTPTKCCNHLDNPLIAKVLHASAVGVGFIPVLPTADKIQSKCPAAGRTGINPVPTAVKCCKCLIISALDRILDRVVAVINPRACVYGFFAGAALVALRRRINLIAVCTLVVDCNYGLLYACRLCGNVKVFQNDCTFDVPLLLSDYHHSETYHSGSQSGPFLLTKWTVLRSKRSVSQRQMVCNRLKPT